MTSLNDRDFLITSPSMAGSEDVKAEGIVVSQSPQVLKSILNIIISLSSKDRAVDVEISNEESIQDTGTLSTNIDAYLSAQVLTDIKESSNSVFIKKAIERGLKKSGTFDNHDLVIGEQAMVTGVLTLCFFNALTKLNIIEQNAEFIKTETVADFARAFLIGCGITWLTNKGSLAISRAEKDVKINDNLAKSSGSEVPPTEEEQFNEIKTAKRGDRQARNAWAADSLDASRCTEARMHSGCPPSPVGLPALHFAETPGKNAIAHENKDVIDNQVAMVDRGRAINQEDSEEKAKSGDLLLNDELETKRRELLTFKDYISYITNFLINDLSEVKTLIVSLVNSLLTESNFKTYVALTSNTTFNNNQSLQEIIRKARGSSVGTDNQDEPEEEYVFLDSKGYELLSLLTLISRDLTNLYIKQRSAILESVRAAQAEEEERQQAAIAEEEESRATEPTEEQALDLERASLDNEMKAEQLKKIKKRKA